MAWLKRMIGGSVIAAMVAVALVPAAHASDQDERELRANRKDKAMPQHQLRKPHRVPSAQRLSPEERRQLRRDIKDAGREIYPPPR
jgi:hypothetical protein